MSGDSGSRPRRGRSASAWLVLEAAACLLFAFRHRGGIPIPGFALLAAISVAAAVFLARLALCGLARRCASPVTEVAGRLALALSPTLLLLLDFVREKYVLRDVSALLPLLAAGGSSYLLAALFCKSPGRGPRPEAAAAGRLLPETIPGRRALLAVFLASWLAYSLVLLSGAFPSMPFTGDEPHYLLTTKSMVRDRDIDVYNNYLHRDYWEFYPGEISRHAYPGKRGPTHLYSKHLPALSLLLVPSYWCGDRLGLGTARSQASLPHERRGRVLLARATMTLLTALLATVFFLMAWELTGSRRIAWLSWFCFAFCQPVVSYSGLLYPEIPVALVLLLLMRQATSRKPASDRAVFWSGAGIAILPWFGIKYALAAVVALVFFIISNRKAMAERKRRLLLLLLPVGVSAFLFLDFLIRLYGTVSPFAVYFGTAAAAARQSHYLHFDLARLAASLLGHFLDQRAGLFIHSPLYILFIPGCVVAFRKNRAAFAACFALFASCWLLGGSWDFAVNFAPPGRPLLPVIPILALWAVAAAAGARSRTAPAITRMLAMISLFMGWLVITQPQLFYHLGSAGDSLSSDTQANWLLRISNIAFDFTRAVPNLLHPPDISWAVAACWIALVTAISLAALKKEGSGPTSVRLGIHAAWILAASILLAAHHFFAVRLDERSRLDLPGGAVFFQDQNSFGAELGGFWTRGNSRCEVVLRSSRPCLRVTLELSSPAPVRAAVTWGSGPATSRVSLSGPTSARVTLPTPRGLPWKGAYLYLLRFEVAGGFRPGILDRHNPDPRFLGVFVRWLQP